MLYLNEQYIQQATIVYIFFYYLLILLLKISLRSLLYFIFIIKFIFIFSVKDFKVYKV